jgi:hypothetical protein
MMLATEADIRPLSPTYAATTHGRSAAVSAERPLLAAIGVQIAFLIPCLIALAVDERTLNGVSVWSKPIKFELSITITVATVIWLMRLLDAEALKSRTVRWAAMIIALMNVLEIAYIVLQAARGRASHFNNSTPIETVLYALMGTGAASIVIGCFVIGLVIWRRGREDAPAGLRYGGASGLMIGAVLTLITAGILSSGTIAPAGHWVGGLRTDAGGLFLFGWSRTGGDLRVPHFFATHMMQALPLLGLLLDRYLPAHVRTGLLVGGAACLLVVAGTFIQAATGHPFL